MNLGALFNAGNHRLLSIDALPVRPYSCSTYFKLLVIQHGYKLEGISEKTRYILNALKHILRAHYLGTMFK